MDHEEFIKLFDLQSEDKSIMCGKPQAKEAVGYMLERIGAKSGYTYDLDVSLVYLLCHVFKKLEEFGGE